MTQRIYKYPLPITDEQDLLLPTGSQVLSVAAQNDAVVLYAMVDSAERNKESHHIAIRGTGHEADGINGRFVGTVPMAGGLLMWHIFHGPIYGIAIASTTYTALPDDEVPE